LIKLVGSTTKGLTATKYHVPFPSLPLRDTLEHGALYYIKLPGAPTAVARAAVRATERSFITHWLFPVAGNASYFI